MSGLEKVAVVGATGPTGRHLVRALLARGRSVRAISRSESNLAARFPDDAVDKVAADATDASAIARALEGCDLVYDCIGLPGELMHLHPVTARHLARATRASGARAIHVSSFWAYLPIETLPLTESHPREGGPEWAKLRRETEDILQDAGACVLHLPDFYGPWVHTSTIQNALIDAVNDRPMNWVGGADVEHEAVYVPDAMRIAADIASHEEAFGERYVLPGSGTVTGAEIAYLANGTLRPASPFLLKIVSLFDKDLRSFMPMVPHYAKTITYDAAKLRGVLGDVTPTPYADGIRHTLDALRS